MLIPDSVTSIGNYAFYHCYVLQSVVIPDSVTSIGASAFYNCNALQFIEYNGTFTSAMNGTTIFQSAELLTIINIKGAKFTKFDANGASGMLNKLGSEGNIDGYDSPLRLDWANCTWSGASPQLNISYCMLSGDQLNAIFRHLLESPGGFLGKTVDITGCTGAANCDRTIITNAGGTVTG